jgi:hypothetical protein
VIGRLGTLVNRGGSGGKRLHLLRIVQVGAGKRRTGRHLALPATIHDGDAVAAPQ